MQFREEKEDLQLQSRSLGLQNVDTAACTYEKSALWRKYTDGMDDPKQHEEFLRCISLNTFGMKQVQRIDFPSCLLYEYPTKLVSIFIRGRFVLCD